ncbi:hypothetical protein L6452_15116 [Arctium lappa]|uniref:Uncharacterized protein n=1 Tax=Arctium lappa TaxID=4217 RepID=A0ACB9CMU7_ARCLA|nr:hypothetical protein L6452_15116 [Arctium lappa]
MLEKVELFQFSKNFFPPLHPWIPNQGEIFRTQSKKWPESVTQSKKWSETIPATLVGVHTIIDCATGRPEEPIKTCILLLSGAIKEWF